MSATAYYRNGSILVVCNHCAAEHLTKTQREAGEWQRAHECEGEK